MSKARSTIPQRSFVRVGLKKDGSAETYIYKEVGGKPRSKGLWASFLPPSAHRLTRKLRRDYLRVVRSFSG